ncbi:FAD-dependent oxidoreductase [Saccharopolyspora mangrovi]|uniref:NAD(P)/FAD-dependent oxidoreductase n=1 Tax=Saccharopolyspora mangrovi TaxID=3082379 RepID=A0ABU6AIP9_9PSEU|nr:NAD(P)/FAD-dependent oxidoreductase [Saccharopolyspora sp. S2-29]MEB3371441.1 NAD(P)/FAD-dependent oxidoreductase [Saccharopolyspora sp. S2-29]
MHVVVSGGGIAGTALALALRTAGIGVTVVESRPADHGEGAVVRLSPNGMDALRAVGAHQPLIARSFPLVRSERIRPDGSRLGYALGADPSCERGLPRVMHWPVLSAVLREQAIDRGAEFRHGHRAVDADVEQPAVTLADGSTVEGDVLVGADGANSLVRGRINPDGPEPERLGTRTVYGYAADPGCEPPPPEVLRSYLGAKAFFAATRDSHSGGCFWFTSLRAPDPRRRDDPQNTDELRAEMSVLFAGEDTIAPTVVGNSDRILSFDDHALPHVPRWHTDRAIIIGDALHVAPPASEQGAAMAVEDGVQLARCLRDHATPAAAFAAFEGLRRDRVEAVVAMGRLGTSRAHHPLARRLRGLRTKAKRLVEWQRKPPMGRGWAYDHHIDWPQTTT